MTSTGASNNIPRPNPSETWSDILVQSLPNGGMNGMGYGNLNIFSEDNLEFAELCENCTKLDLDSRLRIDRGIINIGPLTHYLCLACPLCALVWDSVRLHWGPENPLVPHNEEPTLHIVRSHNNLHLFMTQRPPGFSGPGIERICSGKDVFHISPWDFWNSELPVMSGVIKRKMIGSRLDISMLRRLLDGCTDHDLCRNRHIENRNFLSGFRLIDVYEARLVEITHPCKYFALSYVWGSSQNTGLQTTKRNLDSLRQPSALKRKSQNHEERLPLTISDTIDLCKWLGQRYLWVDCLCIVQGDPEEKMRLIHGMGQVYENASLTIFAVSGSNADHGLAGVTSRKDLRREKIYSFDTPEGALILALARLSLREQIEISHWNTRGWTYQEQALSERRLYLTAEEAFFVCPESNWHEGYQQDDGLPQPQGAGDSVFANIPSYGFDEYFISVPDRRYSGPNDWQAFESAVSVYTRKNLSHPEDALYAFSGIYDRFASIDHDDPGIIVTQGILLSSFPFSLFWYGVHDGLTKIERRSDIHNMRLSSWSWASWIGPIDFVSLYETGWTSKQDFVTRNSRRCSDLGKLKDALHCFVDYWFITHRQRDAIIRTNFSTLPLQPDIPEDTGNVAFYYLDLSCEREHLGTKKQLLSIFPDKPQLCECQIEVGTLNFVAPCFAYPSGMTKSAQVPRLGQQNFEFPGTNTVCCAIQFDSTDEEIHDLALIYYDGSYQALCIKTVNGISTRVGLAVMSDEPRAWRTFIQSGFLTIEWKQIELR
jgi:hypothetical protein